MKTTRESALDKLAEMVDGKEVICSNAQLESLLGNPVLDYVISIPNPKRVGLLDQYLACIPSRFKQDARKAYAVGHKDMGDHMTFLERIRQREPITLGADTLTASVTYFRANPEEKAVYVRWDSKCIPEKEMVGKCGFSRTAQLVSIATDGFPMYVSRLHKHVAKALTEAQE